MPAEYDHDLYRWSQDTAQALAEGRLNEIDLEHVADEISDLGKTEKRVLESQIVRLLVHLLKIEHQPTRHTRSWDLSIQEARLRVRRTLADSPSLAARVPDIIVDVYPIARLKAARQTHLSLEIFPSECPYTITGVLG